MIRCATPGKRKAPHPSVRRLCVGGRFQKFDSDYSAAIPSASTAVAAIISAAVATEAEVESYSRSAVVGPMGIRVIAFPGVSARARRVVCRDPAVANMAIVPVGSVVGVNGLVAMLTSSDFLLLVARFRLSGSKSKQR